MRLATADELNERATKLEDEAIRTAEMGLDYGDWPRREMSKIAHAELKLKAAAILRARARGES